MSEERVSERMIGAPCPKSMRRFWIPLVFTLATPLACLGAENMMKNPMLNGTPVRPSDRPLFPPSTPLDVCFSLEHYIYSGPAGQQEYLFLIIAPEGHSVVNLAALPLEQIGLIDGREASGVHNPNILHCHQMQTPPHEGSYMIYTIVFPYLTQTKLFPSESKDSTLAVVAAPDRARVLHHIETYTSSRFPVAGFKTGKARDESAQPAYSTYLRINGKTPVGESIKAGLSSQPAVLTWETLPKGAKFEYRYRIYPDEIDWSPWSSALEYRISFLPVGAHAFQLEPRYIDSQGHEQSLPVALYQFILEQPFVAAPSKGTGTEDAEHPLPPQIQYPSSEALVLAIPTFSAFPDLPFVNEDAVAMKNVLTKRGFRVTAPSTTVRKQAVLDTVEEFLSKTVPDARVVIYLSTHGFVAPGHAARNYLATADCDPKKPIGSCIQVSDLEQTILALLEDKEIRHFLLIVDACASGMEIATKSYSFPEAGTWRPGAHVITAGTAEEEARASADGKMSVFTKYLVEGLDGKADTYQDGVITVSELLTYVRWHVATESHSAQTPMLGRLSGSGEMLFQLAPSH